MVPENNIVNSSNVDANFDFNYIFNCNNDIHTNENFSQETTSGSNEDIENKDNFNYVNTTNSYISYYYTNIDQLAIKSTNKKEELKLIVSEEKPDLIGITEILSQNNKDFMPAELKVDDYDCFYTENL